jgi:hypothetical protein
VPPRWHTSQADPDEVGTAPPVCKQVRAATGQNWPNARIDRLKLACGMDVRPSLLSSSFWPDR